MLEGERLTEDEYEKQYYGFSSTELYASIKDLSSKAIKMALTEIETALISEEKYNKSLREQKILEFYTMYMKSAKIPLEKFKNEARKIFAIPKNVVLDEDEYKTNHVSDEDIIQLKKEVAEMEKELLREQVFLAKCKQQKEIIDSKIKPTYEKVDFILKSVKNVQGTIELAENIQKLTERHKEHLQYYFGNEDDSTANLTAIEGDFIKIKNDLFQ